MSEPRYAYSKQTSATPIRSALPGHKNIPMSYSGPPTAAEKKRNKNRNDQSRSSIAMNN